MKVQHLLELNSRELRAETNQAKRIDLLKERGLLKELLLGQPRGMGSKNLQKELAPGTCGRYHAGMSTEVWAEIEGLKGYEVSNSGRVRKWTTIGGRPGPRVYRGTLQGDSVMYRLRGGIYDADDLVRQAFGKDPDGSGDYRYSPQQLDRRLSEYELAEIRDAEGYAPAYKVAEDFRIDMARVRGIWDGAE